MKNPLKGPNTGERYSDHVYQTTPLQSNKQQLEEARKSRRAALSEACPTFNNKGLSQQAQVVGGLVVLCQLLQPHPGTHSLGVPVATLHVVDFGHQQQSLI